jgi:hypothetical protein
MTAASYVGLVTGACPVDLGIVGGRRREQTVAASLAVIKAERRVAASAARGRPRGRRPPPADR